MKKGFTLIELLGILALLGIIILVAMPSLINSNKKAAENKVKDACDVIETACDSYRVIHESETSVTIGVLKNEGFLKNDFSVDNLNDDITLQINSDSCDMPDVCNN